MTTTILRGGHVIDPANGVDRLADVVLDGGRIVGIDVPAPPGSDIVDVTGAHVSPGWVDSHVHVFGDIGLDDPDSAGVFAGVTTLIDAGSSGSLTVDEFLARTGQSMTDVRSVLFLDRRGIADTASIPVDIADIPPVPIGELRRAIDRHGDRIVAVKTGIYADLGSAWTRLAMAAAELVERPAFFHIGNFGTHRSSDERVMTEMLELLRPGDVVTHCYTAQPGNLLDRNGELLPAALDASRRGVVFDLGHSGAGFDPEVARTAIDAGLIADTVSSDIAVINVRQRVRSLAHVLGKVLALGVDLADLVRMITAAPSSVYGLPGGRLDRGAPADLTVFDTASPQEISVRFTVRDGVIVAPRPDAAGASSNIRFHVLDAPGAPTDGGEQCAALLGRLARCQRDLPADGEVIQLVVGHLAAEAELPVDRAATIVRRAFVDRDSGNPPGWMLAELRAARGTDWVVDRLEAAAAAALDRTLQEEPT